MVELTLKIPPPTPTNILRWAEAHPTCISRALHREILSALYENAVSVDFQHINGGINCDTNADY